MGCGVLTTTVAGPVAPAAAVRLDPGRDALNAVGRLAWYAGCLTMPAPALRVSILTLSDLCFGVAALAAAMSMARHRLDRIRPAWTIAAVLALVAATLAHPLAGQEDASLAVAIRLVLIWTVWRWTSVSLLGRTEHVLRCLVLFVVGSAASATIALCQVSLGLTVLGSTAAGADSRAAGLASHVNQQGGQLAVAFVIAVALWSHRAFARPVLGALACAIAIGLVLSGSVTGMISAAAAVAYLIVREEGVARRIRLVAVVVAGGYLALEIQQRMEVASPWDRFSDATGGRSATNTLESRLATMRFARDSIESNPWTGVGLDPVSGGTFDGVTLTHNILLLFWYQGGIVLLIALGLAIASAWRLVFARDLGASVLGSALGAGFVGALVFAFTAPVMIDRYFWFAAVLAFPLTAITRSHAAKAQRRVVER